MLRDPTRTIHQTGTAYNKGCRCTICKETHRTRLRKAYLNRRIRTANKEVELKHGNRSTYLNWGCRCEECTRTHVEYCKAYTANKKKTNKESINLHV